MKDEFLGQGTFGKVEKVQVDGNWYARKTIIRDEHDEGIPYTALRECDIYTRFNHPYLVTVYFTTITQHQVQIYMGIADMSVQFYIDECNPTFEQRLQLTKQVLWNVLNALRYLHAYKVLHRDIKPDNVLIRKRQKYSLPSSSSSSSSSILSLSKRQQQQQQSHIFSDYDVYLSDLGSSRCLDPVSMTSKIGTKFYRPPEMYKSNYGKPSDIYCLGCTAIHILNGKIPDSEHSYKPSDWAQLLAKFESRIDLDLYDLIKNMIYSHWEKRITVLSALNHPYFRKLAIPPLLKLYDIPHPGNYFAHIKYIAPYERQSIVEWIVDLMFLNHYSIQTCVHAVNMFDDYLKDIPSKLDNFIELLQASSHHRMAHIAQTRFAIFFHLIALVCAWISIKYIESKIMAVKTLVVISNQFQIEDYLEAEEHVISQLKFRIIRRALPKCLENSKLSISAVKHILTSAQFLLGKYK